MELFHKILNTAVEGGASDVHIKADAPVVCRISSQLVETEMAQQPKEEWLQNIIDNIVPEHFKPRLEEDREIDFSYHVPGIGRFRTNCFQHLGKWCLAMRYVVAEVPKIENLGLPEVAVLRPRSNCGCNGLPLSQMFQMIQTQFKNYV